MKKVVKIGKILIGGDNPVAIQTMATCSINDKKTLIKEASDAKKAGCDIFRVAVLNIESCSLLKDIKKQIEIPIVADIHFNYKLAIAAIENGVDKIRINPGNIKKEGLLEIIKAAKDYNIPIRVGVNGGSINSAFKKEEPVSAMVSSVISYVKFLEDNDFFDIVISVKSSDIKETIEAYRKIDKILNYPLHIGLTEAGTVKKGIMKSAVAIGSLLVDDIGDTIRVSLSAAPKKEVLIAKEILRVVGVDKNYVKVVSCPKCGRSTYNIEKLAKKIESFTENEKIDFKIAVMGCVVNGPGEAGLCDLAIAFGEKKAAVYKNGKFAFSVFLEDVERIFIEEIKKEIKEKKRKIGSF